MDTNNQLVPRSVDLLAPTNRFVATSRLYGQMHRHRLLLGRYWWAVLLILLLVVAPVYFFTAASPPGFESRARMWLTGKLDLSEGRLYTEELVNFLGTQVELLRSRVIQERALARVKAQPENAQTGQLKLTSASQFNPVQELKALWKRLLPADPTAATNAIPDFPFRLKVAESSKSSILELRAIGAEPVTTRAFLDSLMDEYLKFKREARQKTSDRTVASVANQVAQLAGELKAQQEKMYAFQLSNNVVFLQEQGNSAGSYLALLNKQLATLRTELQLLQLLQPEHLLEIGAQSRSVASNEAAPAESVNKEMLASLAGPQSELFKANQQMQLLKAKRQELSRFLRPLHPKILKLDEDIATQEKLAQISRDEALKQLSHRRDALRLEIQNLEAAFKEWDGKALQSSRKMVDYDRIRQDLQRLQGAYDKLLGVIQTVDVSKTIDQENVAVLEPASMARPLHRMFRNMLLAVAVALLCTFALLYLTGKFDDRFASLAELADDLSEAAIGQIPDVALKNPNDKLGLKGLEKQRFEFLEAFRSIRSSLLFMDYNRAKPKTLLIGSSVPQEGKSTVALYLAATISLGGSRVLLIDADMRRPSLHRHFGAPVSPGLAEVLEGEISSAEVISTPTLENLAFLPAGEAQRNPGELVLRPEWGQFLSEVSRLFDYIIIDTPPILAADDAATLASKVDGVLFLVRGSFTSARMARRALDILRQRQIPVLGLVFNRAIFSRYENHYYQQYKDRYRWKPKASRRGGKSGVHETANANSDWKPAA